jgi:organic radical activating enzyme
MITPHEGNLCSPLAAKMISVKLTSECNARCEFCVDRCGFDADHIDVNRIAEEANSLVEYQKVIITGGEPFLQFDSVLALVRLLRPHKSYIILNTNGSLLTKEKMACLDDFVDEIQISIHHHDEERNASVFGVQISFDAIRDACSGGHVRNISINSTFTRYYAENERRTAIGKMVKLCKWIGANKLRLTELKKVSDEQFVPAYLFVSSSDIVSTRCDRDLIERGCVFYRTIDGVDVSIKRLCKYAKGENALAFSCCFIDAEGQKKIDVDTAETFRVIYGDGMVAKDWIFNPVKSEDGGVN